MSGTVPDAVSQLTQSADKVADAIGRFQKYLRSKKRKRLILEELREGTRSHRLPELTYLYLVRKLEAGEDITGHDIINNIDYMIFIREELIMTVEISLSRQNLSREEAGEAVRGILTLMASLNRLITQFYSLKNWAEKSPFIKVAGDINTLLMATQVATEFLSAKIYSRTVSGDESDERNGDPRTVFEDAESRKLISDICHIFRMLSDKLKSMRLEIAQD